MYGPSFCPVLHGETNVSVTSACSSAIVKNKMFVGLWSNSQFPKCEIVVVASMNETRSARCKMGEHAANLVTDDLRGNFRHEVMFHSNGVKFKCGVHKHHNFQAISKQFHP